MYLRIHRLIPGISVIDLYRLIEDFPRGYLISSKGYLAHLLNSDLHEVLSWLHRVVFTLLPASLINLKDVYGTTKTEARSPHLGLRSVVLTVPRSLVFLRITPLGAHFTYSTHAHNPAGTNLQALIDALDTPALPHSTIVRVISNRKAAYGLVRAAEAHPPIPTAYLALQPFLKSNPGASRDDYDERVAEMCVREDPDVVVLAGWMHVLGEKFLSVLDGSAPRPQGTREGGGERPKAIPVINLHPALPGAFDGAHAIPRAYDAFQRGDVDRVGVMVHRVIREVDRGAPVVVRDVSLEKGEPIEVYEERLHAVEWEVIVEATRMVLDEVCPVLEEGEGVRRGDIELV